MSTMEYGTRHAGDVGPPAMEPAFHCYREEDAFTWEGRIDPNFGRNEDHDLNPIGRLSSDQNYLKTRKRHLRIGTWNVRSLYQAGKLDNLILEMECMKVDIMGVSEVRWTDSGQIIKDNYVFLYSGGNSHRHGVGILMTKEVSRALLGFWPINDRIIMTKIAAKPFNLAILQLYAPTSDYSDEELEVFYETVQHSLRQVKSDEVLIIVGDLNARIGCGKELPVVGPFGLGIRNERGQRLLEFCETNNLVIANTMFQQPKRRLYTWTKPGNTFRSQIDYIMVKNRFRNSIRQSKTYPGADINSDHNPVVATFNLKLKKLRKKHTQLQLDLNMLNDSRIKNKFAIKVNNRFASLITHDAPQQINDNTERIIEDKWSDFKLNIIEVAKQIIPLKAKRFKKPWMKESILNMMEERKRHKNKNTYKDWNRIIKYECKKAKEEWYKLKCTEIEELEKQHKSREMFCTIKQVTSRKKGFQMGCIRGKDHDILFEQQSIKNRWEEYAKELFEDCRGEAPEFEDCEGEPILKEEIEKALKIMKKGKAVGTDEISAEMLKALDGIGAEKLMDLCNSIYQSGLVPQEIRNSVFLPLAKKHRATDCSDYRIISIMSHVTKLLLKIVLERIKSRINMEIGETQCGFRSGKGTRESIFDIRTIIERQLEMQKDIYLCFIDYSKAFDRVRHKPLIERLKNIGLNGKDIRLISNIYWKQKAQFRIDGDLSEKFEIQKGVRQGCVLSPILFCLYTETIFKDLEDENGIVVGGRNFNNLRYADDTVLLASNSRDLQNLLVKVNQRSKEFGLELNVNKTKIMFINRGGLKPNFKIFLEGNALEQVNKFIYLGHQITEDGRCESEIKRRIEIARSAFDGLRSVLTSRDLTLETRGRLNKCYIWSTLLYGAEAWTLNRSSIKKLEAFEMWMYRRMLKISWTQKKTNKEVLDLMDVERSLIKEIKRRKVIYAGHLLRHESLEKFFLEGRVEGRRRRGRQRMTWFQNIKDWTGLSYEDCSRRAQDREVWGSIAVNLLDEDDTY